MAKDIVYTVTPHDVCVVTCLQLRTCMAKDIVYTVTPHDVCVVTCLQLRTCMAKDIVYNVTPHGSAWGRTYSLNSGVYIHYLRVDVNRRVGN